MILLKRMISLTTISLRLEKTFYFYKLYTHVFKQTVDYYRHHGSHVFTCFIDFNKAFDNVDYWLLFCKLIDANDSISCFGATRLLAFW